MNKQPQTRDEQFIIRCIELAEANLDKGELPFGSVIAHGEQVVAEGASCVRGAADITAHAEITAMRAAQRKLHTTANFLDFTIYSNFEPCAMCSFAIRELKFGRVVFALSSPAMGGYTKWQILQDGDLSAHFGAPPEVITGILADRARRSF
jgi:tRNA(adenine34) deaminase